MSKLGKALRTTRGNPRQRALKGMGQDLRLRVLAELPTERLEHMLGVKLKKMDHAARVQVEAELRSKPKDERRAYIIRLLT